MEAKTPASVQERAEADGLSMTVSRRGAAPSWAAEEGGWDSFDWWRATLRRGTDRLAVYFGMGPGHKGREPRLEEVLGSLLDDAAGVLAADSYESWARDLGYEPSDRSARRVYRVAERQTARLQRFLGEQLDAYLYETERG